MARKPKTIPYWTASRDLAVSYIFMIPLLGFYEIGVLLDASVANGADYLFKGFFQVFGQWGMVILNLCLLALLCFSLARVKSARGTRRGIYWGMLLESLAWGVVLFGGAHLVQSLQLSLTPLARDLFAAAGAGVYEEAIFRWLLLGGMVLILSGIQNAPRGLAWAVALVVSAGVFSYAHHTIGAEPFVARVFIFRFVMGILLGLLYLFRGLGIVVYVHAFYNALVALKAHA